MAGLRDPAVQVAGVVHVVAKDDEPAGADGRPGADEHVDAEGRRECGGLLDGDVGAVRAWEGVHQSDVGSSNLAALAVSPRCPTADPAPRGPAVVDARALGEADLLVHEREHADRCLRGRPTRCRADLRRAFPLLPHLRAVVDRHVRYHPEVEDLVV